jgi:decaprenylphospho-beta-D-ribofuranose 2-oxidase
MGRPSAARRAGSPLRADPADRLLTGWARTAPSRARISRVGRLEQVQEAVLAAARDPSRRGLLARGLGGTYGDGAQNAGGTVLDLSALDGIELDAATGTVTAGAGTSLDRLIRTVLPRGWFAPVTPGTRHVTIGGVVAADIHGKNHHVDGAFAAHVRDLQLVTSDAQMRCVGPGSAAADDRQTFWATVGGMGLTGVITRATIGLLPVTSAWMRVETERARDLDDLMTRMHDRDTDHRYVVAWVDSLAGGAAFGRGVISRAQHAEPGELPAAERARPLRMPPAHPLPVPPVVPARLLTRALVHAYNEARFRAAPARRASRLQTLTSFFYPLDAVRGWNRLYGPVGFLQYQFVVPDSAGEVVRVVLERLRGVGAPPFLAVLKRLGPANPAPLSFPRSGWTLAADMPAGVPGLAATLDALDDLVVSSGGRLYLAKDSRMSPSTFARGYPQSARWRGIRDRLDPTGLFVSDLARRLLA